MTRGPHNGRVNSLPVCRCWLCRQEQGGGHATVHRLAHTYAQAAADPGRGWFCPSCGEWISGANRDEHPLCAKCVERTA